MRLNLYSALTILVIVLLSASIVAIGFLFGIADCLYGAAFIFFFSAVAAVFFFSLLLMEISAYQGEPIIIRILDFLAGEDNE